MAVKRWLYGFLILVLLMIVVGGVTRLTRSGLSIVEWRPVSGLVPPITQAQWQTQFDLYKTSPEYQQVNSSFSLDDYKNIFMWEYLHRLLGRVIFFYSLIPGVIFWRQKVLKGSVVLLLCSLVAAQGLVGWLMVKSGLNHEPHVSPFMLALHFFSALTVLLAVYYQICLRRTALVVDSKFFKMFKLWSVFLGVQLFYGCLTSGFRAGFSFNTFPLMAGDFFPAGGLLKEPLWINFFENPATVQWTHRWLGISLFIASLFMLQSARKSWIQLKGPMMHLFGVILVQVILGILNIVFIVPIPLAVTHQLVATVLLMASFNILFRARANG